MVEIKVALVSRFERGARVAQGRASDFRNATGSESVFREFSEVGKFVEAEKCSCDVAQDDGVVGSRDLQTTPLFEVG
ncbi:hypothetical protein E4U32_007050 [Claviceps aff. humidiphila group G2b]|nr:hypothetical protein E4U32_007050 [Claviceps aff. humidiphila group G2b]